MPIAEVNGCRLEYQTYGDGFPLLLISGLGSPRRSWLGQIPDYSDHFHCIAYDARGIGASTSVDKPITTTDLASDALGLLDHLGIERCHVVGTSLGALTAQEICLASDRVERLVQHAPWDWTAAYPHLTRQFELRIKLIRNREFELYEELSQLWLVSPDYLNSAPNAHPGRQRAPTSDSEWDAIARLLEANLAHDTRGRLVNITVPTLITVGSDDFLVRPSYAQNVADQMPAARLVVWEGAGHLARQEQAAVFTHDTLTFLAASE